MISVDGIDHGESFDWGKASADYAKYRDIYPREFYEKILSLGICTAGHKVLDLGTGTGVLPRNMYQYGAAFIGTDIAENQIAFARKLSEGMNIEYAVAGAETVDYPDGTFDDITACQCWFYFNHELAAPRLYRQLRSGGKLAFLSMEWLPYEDKVADASEKLVLKYSPSWTGSGETRHKTEMPQPYSEFFTLGESIIFDVDVPFTRESWNGRMKACRGIDASLTAERVEEFSREHLALLEKIADESFTVKHFCAITVMNRK